MTNNTIPNVPRELLERAATSIEQRMCIQCEGVPCCMPESLNTLSDIRALLAAPSPAGVVAALLAERAELKRDAERYRHASKRESDGDVDICICKVVWNLSGTADYVILTGDKAHTVIDAVMQAAPAADAGEVLRPALRQYLHNDGSGLVAGYDLELTQRIVSALQASAMVVPDCFESYRLADKFCEQRLVTDDRVRAIVVDAFASGYGFGIAAALSAGKEVTSNEFQ